MHDWMKFLLSAAIGSLSMPTISTAGHIAEANIVFADPAIPSNPTVGDAIRDSINSEIPECRAKGSGGVVYIKHRPAGVTDSLLGLTILKRDQHAQESLSALLIAYEDEGVRGLDGVVAYLNKPSPRLVSFTAVRKKIATQTINDITVRRDIELSLCAVKPAIVRRP